MRVQLKARFCWGILSGESGGTKPRFCVECCGRMTSSQSDLFLRRMYLGVSKNRGARVFHYKPSILGYPYFWKHPFGISLKQKKSPCAIQFMSS